jgi:hypothetical protein
MATALWIAVGTVAGGALYLALRALVRTYLRYRGTRVVTCPETTAPAAVDVDAVFAAMSQASLGSPVLRLVACSRWPERQDCGQACLAQIEAAPEACLARTMVERWYRGRTCVFCRRPFVDLGWAEHKPALRAPGGETVQWNEIRAEELPAVFTSHGPVCWNCHIAETFRRRHPELVVEGRPSRP